MLFMSLLPVQNISSSRLAPRYSRLAALCLLTLLWVMATPASAQVPVLTFGGDIDADLTPPTYAHNPSAVRIDPEALALLEVGGHLLIEVGPGELRGLEVVDLTSYINGDYLVRAQGREDGVFYSLALTVGANNLFGHLSTSAASYQFYAVYRAGLYEGWMYEPQGLKVSDNAFANDYLIPDYTSSDTVSRPTLELVPQLPLVGTPTSNSDSDTASATQSDIDSSNFRVSQRFSRNPVIVGGQVEAQVTFENISDQWHRGLSVEFYFLLENSRLVLAPDYCQEQVSLSLQDVLYCDLGDFAPGQSKTFYYVVATNETSKPHVLSTPVVGNVRLDSFINVVDDVRHDSDGDGLSDFNESLIGTDPFDADSVDLSDVVIDVMAFYTPGAAALYPNGVETRINQLISVANQAYAHSGVGIRLRPVYHGQVDFNDSDDMDTALDHLIEKTDPAFTEVDTLRARFGGDLVMLLRPLPENAGRCGLAPVGGFNTNGDFSAETEKQFAYSVIAIDCPTDIVVAHELGHNMGLTHSHLEDGAGGTFNFSTGYGVDSEFVTVMAYPGAFNTDNRIAVFSNPELDCFGLPCGIDGDREFGADAARSLNLVKYQIADYFPATVPDLPVTAVADLNGGATSAAIALAASRDNGLSHTTTVTPADSVDLVADVRPDPAHVDKQGTLHVLIGNESQGFLLLNANGQLTPWDGTVAGLLPTGAPAPLAVAQRLNILRDYHFEESLVGETVSVFLAYQVLETGEFIYTLNPLTLEIQAAPFAEPSSDTSIDISGLKVQYYDGENFDR